LKGCAAAHCPRVWHTGNYRISAEEALPAADVQMMLSKTLRHDFAVFIVNNFLA
jgi:hypothetical protein